MAKAKSAKGKSAEPQATTEARQTLESVAAELEALGVDPVDRLRAMVWAQKRARGLDAVAALKADPLTIYAPAVVDALARAALACRNPRFRPTYRRLFPEDRTLYLVEVTVLDDKRAQGVILAASAALRTRNEVNLLNARREARLTAAFILAKEVQAEAERLAGEHGRFRTAEGKPNVAAVTKAREVVAGRQPIPEGKTLKPGEVWNGVSVEALQKRIREARDEEPRFPWPEIMPGRRGNRRA